METQRMSSNRIYRHILLGFGLEIDSTSVPIRVGVKQKKEKCANLSGSIKGGFRLMRDDLCSHSGKRKQVKPMLSSCGSSCCCVDSFL